MTSYNKQKDSAVILISAILSYLLISWIATPNLNEWNVVTYTLYFMVFVIIAFITGLLIYKKD